jgi:hypothetical protein
VSPLRLFSVFVLLIFLVFCVFIVFLLCLRPVSILPSPFLIVPSVFFHVYSDRNNT